MATPVARDVIETCASAGHDWLTGPAQSVWHVQVVVTRGQQDEELELDEEVLEEDKLELLDEGDDEDELLLDEDELGKLLEEDELELLDGGELLDEEEDDDELLLEDDELELDEELLEDEDDEEELLLDDDELELLEDELGKLLDELLEDELGKPLDEDELELLDGSELFDEDDELLDMVRPPKVAQTPVAIPPIKTPRVACPNYRNDDQ